MFHSFRLVHRLKPLLFSLIAIGCSMSASQAGPPVNRAAVLDFDGDGKTDYVVVRRELPGVDFKLVWYIRGSTVGDYAQQWGLDGMQMVPADYDGDGKWDIAVWAPTPGGNRQAYFHVWRSSDNTYQKIPWGTLYDDPLLTQDFDGDGKADPTVVRTESSTGNLLWYTLMSTTNEVRLVQFGGPDRPLRGDFDGDGKADVALYRREFGTPSSTFIILRSSDQRIQFYPFGAVETDHFLPADFDGDGKTDFTIVRSIDNAQWWFWRESSTGEIRAQQFGRYFPNISFDSYAPGDYDGDGKTDLAVWRNVDFGGIPAHFYVAGSRDGMFVMPWGSSGTDSVLAGELQFR